MAAGGGKISKLLGGGLLLLLVAGLAGFGATSFGGSVSAIGRVGKTEIPAQEYARSLSSELQAFEAQIGQNLPLAQAQQIGLTDRVLQQMINSAALEDEAARAGLSVGDLAVRDQITSIAGFQGLDGKFDGEAYRFALQNAGLNAREFEADIRGELARGLLQSAVAFGAQMPAAYTDTLINYIGERRDLAWVQLGPDDLNDPLAEPTDAELQAYYEAHPEDFTLPAAKLLSYIWLSPEMVMDENPADEADLRQMFEARSDEYNLPERRLVERLVFGTEEEAAEARAALDAGDTDFETLVEGRGLTLADIDMGDVARRDLSTAAAEAVFNLENPGIVGPLMTDLGPALLRMNAILEGQETPFEDVRDELSAELLADNARRAISDRVDQIDDLLAGGATLEEVAEEEGLTLDTVRWTPELDTGIAAFEEFADAARTVTADDFPEVTLLFDGGIFALRLDGEEGPKLQPIEDVKVAVIQGWEAEQTATRLTEQAKALQARLNEGATIDALDADVTRAADVKRDGFLAGTPPVMLAQAFVLQEGQNVIVAGQVNGSENVALILVEAVKAPAQDDPDLSQLRTQLSAQAQQSISADLLDDFSQAIRAEVGVEIRQSAVNSVHAAFP